MFDFKNFERFMNLSEGAEDPSIPRPEYPRPQFVRPYWQNLNGTWRFEFDEQNIGLKEHWEASHSYSKTITVPFVYQSELSGLHDLRFIDYVWYEREFDLKYQLNDPKTKRVVLHFGAIDFFCRVYINGVEVCCHTGGSSPFHVEITDYLNSGVANGTKGSSVDKKNKLTVYVRDIATDAKLPRGKQCTTKKMGGCSYEKITGIWQTVWLEYLPETSILPEKTNFHAYIDNNDNTKRKGNSELAVVDVSTQVDKYSAKYIIEVELFDGDTLISEPCFHFKPNYRQDETNEICELKVKIPNHKITVWEPFKPYLYRAQITVKDGESDDEDVVDVLQCYFAFRDISLRGNRLYVNEEDFFLKSMLYQGYFPDGLWTAPSDAALRNDIELTIEMGCNHLRLHQIYADPRLLYWADVLGMTLWGEAPNAFAYDPEAQNYLINEWMTIVLRDRNHPSIIAWVPINESWGSNNLMNSEEQRNFLRSLYYLTKNMDGTRPVVDNDGWEHVKTDIVTIHLYVDPEKLMTLPVFSPPRDDNLAILNKISHRPAFAGPTVYEGQPIMITEWGGWGYYAPNPNAKSHHEIAWGYGGRLYADFDDILDLYQRYIDEIKKRSTWIRGLCYTEFCDQYQEVNGFLTFDRKPKCDLKKLKAIHDQI